MSDETTNAQGGESQETPLYWLGRQLIEKRAVVMALVFVVTAFFGFHAYKLYDAGFVTSFGDLLPQTHPFMKVHNQYAPTFGGANNVVVMLQVEEGSIFTKETLTKIFEMTEALDRVYGVNHNQIESIGHRTTRFLQVAAGGLMNSQPVMLGPPRTDAKANEIKDIVHNTESIYGILVSLDDKAALLRANFIEGRLDYRRIFDEIQTNVVEPYEDENTKIYVAGEPTLYGWVYSYAGEVKWIFLATTIFVWILLYLYFHDWRGALRPTITGLISAIWGLGFIHLIGLSFDPLALVIPFFITARAVSHSVQMHDRYYEEYEKSGWQKEPAIVASFAELFVPTLSGILTDAIGILAILLVPILMLQKLSLSASFWILAITVSELLLNPIVYYYLNPPDREVVEHRESGWFRNFIFTSADAILSPIGRKVTLGIWGAVAVASLYFIQGLTIGDPTAASPLLWLDSPYNVAHTQIQDAFGGVEPLIVVAEGQDRNAMKQPEVLRTMEKLQRHIERDPDIGYSFSLADILRSVNMVFHEVEPKWGVIPNSRELVGQLFFVFFSGSPPTETAKYVTPDYTTAHVTFFCKNHKGENIRRIIQRIREFIAENPMEHAQFRLAGGLIGVLAAANEEILRNDLLMNFLGFTTIYVIILFTYRSWLAGILMLIPLFLSNLAINAYMSVMNIGINVSTLPVVTVGIGFGIDYGLYIVSRIIEEYETRKDMDDAVRMAVATAGKAVTFTATTMVFGTLAWYFSSIRFDAEMGLLLALWMAVSFLATMTLMPVIFAMAKPQFVVTQAERIAAGEASAH